MTTIPQWVSIGAVTPAGTANIQATAKELRATIVAGEAPIPVVYGEVQIGGQVFATTFAGGFWYLGVLFCVGEVEAVDAIYLNGAAPVSGVTVNTYTGTTGQTADALLSAAISGYADTLVISHPAGDVGICYAVIKYTDAHYSGLPSMVAKIRGRKVYNTATTLTAYTANPALCLRDFISNAAFGMGETVDDASATIVASACDAVVVANARRTIGLAITSAKDPQKWGDILAMYAGAWVFKSSDKWAFIADRPASSVATFTDANIVADTFKIAIADSAQAPTVIEVAYIDKTDLQWRERTAPAELPGVSTGATPRRVSRVNMLGVNRYEQAKREAQERLNKLQQTVSIAFTAFDNHIGVEIGDVITVTHSYGISAQEFRVKKQPKLVSPGRVAIEAVWYDAADYNDTETAAPTYGDSADRLGVEPTSDELTGAGDWPDVTNKPDFGDLSLLDLIDTDEVVANAITGHVISEETTDQTVVPRRPTGTVVPSLDISIASVVHTLANVAIAGPGDVVDVTFDVRLSMTNYYTNLVYNSIKYNNSMYFAVRRGISGPVVHREILNVRTPTGSNVYTNGNLFVPAIGVVDTGVAAGAYTYYLYIQPIDMVYQIYSGQAMITKVTNSTGRAVVYKK